MSVSDDPVELPPVGKRVPAFKIILIFFLLMVFAVFVVKNLQEVEVSYYDYTLSLHTLKMPLFLVVIVSFGGGFMLAWLFGAFTQLRLMNRLRKTERSLRRQGEEMDKLKESSRTVETRR